MTLTIGAIVVTIATFIAVWVNDHLPGGGLPDSFFENNDQSEEHKLEH